MADQLSPLSVPVKGITITRVFDAPPLLVWKEWTEPRRFADWFGGAEIEVPLMSVSLDLRPGGAWRATTLSYGRDRRDICWKGEYLEIIEPERLAFTILGLPGQQTPDVVTVSLTALPGGRTKMFFRQEGQRTTEQFARAREAWSAEFDRIAERVVGAELGDATCWPMSGNLIGSG